MGPLTLHWSHHTTSDREAGARTAGGVREPIVKDAHLMRRQEHVDMLAHFTARASSPTAWRARRVAGGHNLRSVRHAVVGCSGDGHLGGGHLGGGHLLTGVGLGLGAEREIV